MTNEMKLLRAFIEASGYEIQERIEWVSDGIDHWPNRGKPNICVTDYKVTKKPDEGNTPQTLRDAGCTPPHLRRGWAMPL